jgi:hypothetical protein
VKLRFQADADLNHAIAKGLERRSQEIDFQSANAVPLEGLGDLLVLALAADQNRVVVSHDQNTMELHFRHFVQQQCSPGLILVPQRLAIGAAIHDLNLIWEILTPSDLENRTCLLPSLVVYAP